MVTISEYKMRHGENIENKNLEALEETYLQDNPILKDYHYKIIYNTGKKNTLGFGIEFIDPEAFDEFEDTSVLDDGLVDINKFLKEATGRNAKLRKKDLKSKSS